jgi:hypothetical protein
MRKNKWAKVAWLFLGLAPLLLAACGGNSSTATTPAPKEPVLATAVPVLDEVETEGEMGETVSAKPQLIEFYADW